MEEMLFSSQLELLGLTIVLFSPRQCQRKKATAEDALLLFMAIFKDTKIEMLILSFNVLTKAFGNGLRGTILNLNTKDF